jgi:ribosomal protein L32E
VFKRIPFFKLLALTQIAMLARQHFRRLDANERRRLVDLVRHPRGLTAADKAELKGLVAKLEPGAFAGNAARRAAPLGRRR